MAASPNPFDGAEASVDTQKRALLAAIAQQGSAAKAQFAAQADAAAQSRTAAVGAAGERAGAINAPAAAIAQLQAKAQQPGDTYAADAYRAAVAANNEDARLTHANSDYMDQVKAAIPIARSVADARIAEIKAQEARQAAGDRFAAEDQAWQREQRQWAREDRWNEASKGKKDDVWANTITAQDAANRLGWKNPGVLKSATSSADFGEDFSTAADWLSKGKSPEEVRTRIRAAYPEGGSIPDLIITMLGIAGPEDVIRFQQYYGTDPAAFGVGAVASTPTLTRGGLS